MITEKLEGHAVGECFAAHRTLWEEAAKLSRKLTTASDDGYLLQLGASCMRIAAENALNARSQWQALRSWRECILADRQIKIGIYLAMKRGAIDTGTYDAMFVLASNVARIREDERQRLRREINRNAIV